ncbi:hypothetical protein [Streptomyces sp. NPDC005805]|uniref:hypothetical protein n=1 Tax=Streptomyces sp. NPDC005805 TaxID=3157068 RepID=UPI0033FF6D42
MKHRLRLGPRLRGRPAAWLLAALLPLTACGIQETDVIEAGSPPVLDILPGPGVSMLLFFVSTDGQLMPVPRMVDNAWGAGNNEDGFFGSEYEEPPTQGAVPGPPSPVKAVAELLAGPRENERRAGLRNDPALPAPAAAPKEVTAAGDTVTAVFAAPLGDLGPVARRQLVCTISHAQRADGTLRVVLRGTDGPLPGARCRPGAGATSPPD